MVVSQISTARDFLRLHQWTGGERFANIVSQSTRFPSVKPTTIDQPSLIKLPEQICLPSLSRREISERFGRRGKSRKLIRKSSSEKEEEKGEE